MLNTRYLINTIIVMIQDKKEEKDEKPKDDKSIYSEDVLAIINNQYRVSNKTNSKSI